MELQRETSRRIIIIITRKTNALIMRAWQWLVNETEKENLARVSNMRERVSQKFQKIIKKLFFLYVILTA